MSQILGAQPTGAGDPVKDVTIETFEEDVLTASMTRPVIVDFWADWCGPCKQLAPPLERAVAAANGAVALVKVDIDKNQMLASQLRIQSIPTVYAFFQGRPVDGFQGNVPESEIKAFIERLTTMVGDAAAGPAQNGVEDYISAGEAALAEGDIAAAAQLFGQAAQMAPDNIAAIAGLARCQLAAGDVDQARQTLALAPEDKQNDPALQSVSAALDLAAASNDVGDLATLEAAVAASPDDHGARYSLAEARIAAGAMDGAMGDLLAIIERDREWNEGAARQKLLTVFDALGAAHPATVKGRRRLSSILFS